MEGCAKSRGHPAWLTRSGGRHEWITRSVSTRTATYYKNLDPAETWTCPPRHSGERRMLNGLDMFSRSGELTAALSDWVVPIAYCEENQSATDLLLQRMSVGKLPIAPIWDKLTTLTGDLLPQIDIMYGELPTACKGKGEAARDLDKKRFDVLPEVGRAVRDLRPLFVFLIDLPIASPQHLEIVHQEFLKLAICVVGPRLTIPMDRSGGSCWPSNFTCDSLIHPSA
ncbi:MAG: hypothetical protein R3B45_07725 [Bdellovibrionota bacterium]